MGKRVAITGMGLVAPLGLDLKTNWENLMKAKPGVCHISSFDASTFPVQIAGEVKDFDESSIKLPGELEDFTGRATKLSIAATREAMENSGVDLNKIDPTRLGVSLGASEETYKLSNIAAAFHIEDFYRSLKDSNLSYFRKSKYMGQIWGIRRDAYIQPSILSMLYNARGCISVSSTACASSAQAIGKAMKMIEYGDADIMIAGGGGTYIDEITISGFAILGALSQNNKHPEKASRPFDRRRDGFVLAEGAGIIILEESNHARERGAKIMAEMTGFGTSSNAYRITDSPPDGRGADQAMKLALKDAGLSSEDVDHINAHGTSTLINDRSETLAIKKVFGKAAYKIPITANKSMLGHPIAGAGAIELIISILTIQNNTIPPTINYEVPDPDCDLDYVPNEPRECEVNTVLSNSFAFGGQNASIVVERYHDADAN